MMRHLLFSGLVFLFAAPAVLVTAQEAPREAPAVKTYEKYDALFDDFDARRRVLVTRFERLQQKERVDPDELRRAEAELIALDREYAAALRLYVDGHAGAKDLMPARFELLVTLSRLEDRLADAVATADEFIKNHPDADLLPDARFVKGQSLFRIQGREADALEALEVFIEKHGERQDADAARMMRVRTLLFLDKVADARRSLDALLKADRVKGNAEAKAFLQAQIDALDWIGRDMPRVDLKDADGKPLQSADFAGKPWLLFVWDTTSSACMGELPFVLEMHQRHSEKMGVLGISVNESQAAFEQWLARNSETMKFRNGWLDREAEGTVIKRLAVSVIPFNVLVDANGKVYRYDVRSDDLLRYAARLTR